jgi:hypothetical protein
MIRRILIISTVPEARLAALARELRLRYSGAQITALVGVTPVTAANRDAAEYLVWGHYRLRALIGELRGRRFDLAVVAHGRDQCLSRRYWGAVAVAVLVGPFGMYSLCEDAQLTRSTVPAGALGRAAAQLAAEGYVALTGLLWLLPVLVGAAVVDLTEATVGRWSAGVSPLKGKERD